jgi:oligoendopeptidase F
MSIMPKLLSAVLGTLMFATTAEAAGQEHSKVPPRSEIRDEYKWNLQDMYASDDEWQNGFISLKSSLSEMSQYKNKLGQSSEILLSCLKTRDRINVASEKIFAYARMHRDENNADTKYQAMTGKAESLLSEAGEATAFVEPEILAIPDAKLADFRKAEARLAEYSFFFENLQRQKKHILSPREEELLARMNEVSDASANTFNMLAHADMKFPEIADSAGKPLQLSEARYRLFIMSPDRELRQQAFTGLFGAYNQYRNTFASTLSGNVKKNIFFANSRKYESALDAALEPNNVPPTVYNNVISTVENNLQPLHRYVALKKKALKLDEIHMYDLYTPIVPDIQLTYSYEEGRDLVRKALQPLGDDYLTALEQGLSNSWIDVYENQGKQTGAYSWGVFGVHPFILLNYNNRYDDVSTLAHELGHAIHSFYSHKHQPYINSSYTIFSAEVASTTNETLLMDYMLKTTQDKKVRLYLINQYLEQVRATVYRQTMFAEFEKFLHEKVESGETITADLLDEMWHELNVKYYGNDIVVDSEINVEWARIPHFYSSFYVYQYATGFSAANALADQILKEGQPAQQRYIEFLKSGGSDYSINLLKAAGVDMSSPQAIEVTLAKFSKLLDEFAILLEQ